MAIQLNQLDVILKEVIAPTLQKEFFNKNILLGKISKNKGVNLSNSKFQIPVQTSRFSWVYAVGEWEDPIKGTIGFEKMSVGSKYVFGQFELTDQALEWATTPEAVADILSTYSQNAKESMEREVQRMVTHSAQGVLWTVASDSTGTTVTVDSTFYIENGMQLSIGTKAEVEWGTADNVSVVNVISDTQFTISSATSVTANDEVVKQKVYSNGAYNEWAGIRLLVDDNNSPTSSTFQGIARSSNTWVNAPVYKPTTTETLTIARMREYYFKALKYGNPNIILAWSTLFQKYIDLLGDQVRPATFENAYGYKFEWVWFAWQNWVIPVILDFDVPDDEIYMLDTETFTVWEMAPVSWMNRWEWILKNSGGNSTKYNAILRYYGNLVCFNPRANARLTNMKD